MICEIRFLSRGAKFDKTIARSDRECASMEEALRWAAATLKASTPEDQAQVTSVRVRVVVPGGANA